MCTNLLRVVLHADGKDADAVVLEQLRRRQRCCLRPCSGPASCTDEFSEAPNFRLHRPWVALPLTATPPPALWWACSMIGRWLAPQPWRGDSNSCSVFPHSAIQANWSSNSLPVQIATTSSLNTTKVQRNSVNTRRLSLPPAVGTTMRGALLSAVCPLLGLKFSSAREGSGSSQVGLAIGRQQDHARRPLVRLLQDQAAGVQPRGGIRAATILLSR